MTVTIVLTINFLLFYLNIIPSLLGLYYISLDQINNFDIITLFKIISQIILNIYLIRIILKNLYYFKKLKDIKFNNYLKYFFFYTLIIFVILVFNASFWQVIKLYFYSSFLIFIFLSLDFKKAKINEFYFNPIILILLVIFPLYKFSTYNFGLSRTDSFPSSLNNELKQQYK